MEDIKYNLIPILGEKEVHRIFSSKIEKYGPDGWKKGHKWSKLTSAMKKHLSNFELGQDYDKNGLLNIARVAADALILCEYYNIYPQGDDRCLIPSKPRISLDVDEVVSGFLEAYSKRYNKVLSPYWSGDYDISENLEELMKDKDFWINLPLLRTVPFEPTCYISSRSIPVEWTKEFIIKNNLPCAPVEHVPFNTSKIEVLKKYNIDIHIDDKYENFIECQQNGIFCYLMNSVHNEHYNVGHKRIYDLNICGYGK